MAKAKKQVKQEFSYDLVLISWMDAEASNGWFDNSEVEEYVKKSMTPVISVGFLYKKASKSNPYYVLFADLDDVNGHNNRRIIIPDTWVYSVTVLQKGKKK